MQVLTEWVCNNVDQGILSGFDYSARVSDQSVTSLVLTIKQGKIVKINTGDYTVTKQGRQGLYYRLILRLNTKTNQIIQSA